MSFEHLAPVVDAVAWIDREIGSRVGSEPVPLAEASGRVLAQDLEAAGDAPPFDRAVADGYAVRTEGTVGASPYNPLIFHLTGAGAADAAMDLASAAQVASGSPIPRGADAVVLSDRVERDPGAATIELIEPAIPGAYIERRANDFRRGRLMLRAGHRMRAADPALLAVAGIGRVDVVRRPRVRLVVTGADLCQAGQELRHGAVYDADTPMLRSLVERDGGAAEIWPVDRRFSNAVRDAILTPAADVVMVVGGSGLGAQDLAVLQALAPQAPYQNTGGLAIHGVALRPGASTGLGRVGSTPVILLPGAPVACLWAYELIAGRAVRSLAGRSPELPYASQDFVTARKIVSTIGFAEVWPVRRMSDRDSIEPIPAAAPDGAGSLFATISEADGFVLVPEASEGFPPGTRVRVYLYGDQDSCRDPNSF